MLATIALALLMQAPHKVSALGPAKPPAKPWWETLKPGDVVRVYAPPGARIPRVAIYRGLELEYGMVRDDVYWDIFADDVAHHRWDEIHRMVDRGQNTFFRWRAISAFMPSVHGSPFTVLAIHDDPVLGCQSVDLLNAVLPPGSKLPELPAKLSHVTDDYFRIPIVFCAPPGAPPHPALARMPVLVRHSRDISPIDCQDKDCTHLDAIPYAEAVRLAVEKRRRSEELLRRATAGRR